jgi:hypothetical protein
VKSQGCEPEQALKDCCCRCVQSRRIQHLEVFESFRKECMQESFLKLRVIRKPRRIRPLKLLKDSAEEVVP